MKATPRVLRFTSALAAAMLASACGGGGGSPGVTSGTASRPAPNTPAPTPSNPAPADPAPANPTPTTPANPAAPNPIPAPPAGCRVQVVADTSVAVGKTASASVLSCDAPLASVSWTQVGGPAVELLARRSPTVAFEPAASGTVNLRAEVTLADGSSTSADASVVVAAQAPGSTITVRADHAVRPGDSTSVRAWPALAAGESIASIRWNQIAGAPVSMNTDDPSVLMFDAPTGADRALRFRATLTTSSGRSDSDEVTITLDRATQAGSDAVFGSAARVHPYRQAGRYAPVLARCVYDAALYYRMSGENNLCSANTLPLLQGEAGPGEVPSVEQVMGRVLVSHDFLGANFEQFLRTQDPHGDFRRLFASTTAIVIGSHVRPSFYMPGTGAIYLDANYLWLTPAQRDVVTEVPDYRSDFGSDLNFTALGRAVRNNEYARRYIGVTERSARSIDELVLELGALLYHELAHASDYMPPDQRNLTGTLGIWDNVAPRAMALALPSDVLASRYPLRSEQMKGLGQVLYMGATATAEQRAWNAEQVGAFFASDVASDPYGYAINGSDNSREDLAMLFEEFMMSYRHGVQYDTAYTNAWQPGMTSDQLIVGWGERGRIGEAAIKPRVKLVLERIAPWIDRAAVDSLPAPILLQRGQTWTNTLVVSPAPNGASLSGRSAKLVESPAARAARQRDAFKRARHPH